MSVQKMDENGDGTITVDEFLETCARVRRSESRLQRCQARALLCFRTKQYASRWVFSIQSCWHHRILELFRVLIVHISLRDKLSYVVRLDVQKLYDNTDIGMQNQKGIIVHEGNGYGLPYMSLVSIHRSSASMAAIEAVFLLIINEVDGTFPLSLSITCMLAGELDALIFERL